MDDATRWSASLLSAMGHYQSRPAQQIGLLLVAQRLQLADTLAAMMAYLNEQYPEREDMPNELRAALAALGQP